MVKNKRKLFIHRVPVLTVKNITFQPDLLIAVKDGVLRLSRLQEMADLSKTIRVMEKLLHALKDEKWEQDQRSKR